MDQSSVKAESLRIFNRTFAITAALNAFTLGVAGIALLTSLLTLGNSRLPQLAPLWAIGITRRHLAAIELTRTLAVALITALFALPLGLLVAWCLIAIVNVKAFGWRCRSISSRCNCSNCLVSPCWLRSLQHCFRSHGWRACSPRPWSRSSPMNAKSKISRRAFAGGLALLGFRAPALAQGFAGLGESPTGFAPVVPGRTFSLPADHGPHPDFHIEWWYLTANLTDGNGSAYGAQWTLFRQAMRPGN